MRPVIASSLAIFLFALIPACAAGIANESAPEEAVSSAASPQIDPYKGYTITQLGATAGSAWRGTISTGADVEYWVELPGSSESAPRSFTPTSETCTEWKRTVCSSGWTG